MKSVRISSELIALDVPPAGGKDAVIGQVAELIAASGSSPYAETKAAMLAREEKFSTAMPGGFSMPHCRSAAVVDPAIAVLRLTEPVDFGGRCRPSDLIFGIATPADAEAQYMQLLARLTQSLRREDFLAALRTAKNPEVVAGYIRKALGIPPETPTEAPTEAQRILPETSHETPPQLASRAPGEAISRPSMFSYEAIVGTRVGLHARPAALIAERATQFDADVRLSLAGSSSSISAGSVMEIMMLGAPGGTRIVVESKNKKAAEEIAALINSDLDAQ